ncbi:GNAT family N-acetyltransferase [Pseudoneobacillus sp. C159]
MDINLLFFQLGHIERLKAFHLPPEQEQFTALPIEMLEKNDERHPIVITNEHIPIGFFVLHSSARVQEYTENPHAMLLTAFSVDHAQQGKGFAKAGLAQLKDFVQNEFPQYNEVVLAVNQRNVPAQKLYEKVGFIDTGRRKIGEIGEQKVYSLQV